uniref:Uncharacterized protein n=1 Tax=Streptomyces caniferus TaxID=285557 RepID=A0A493R1B9_9ACTN|nr:hypothetical protein [Streptomyces caniferus]
MARCRLLYGVWAGFRGVRGRAKSEGRGRTALGRWPASARLRLGSRLDQGAAPKNAWSRRLT